MGMSRIHSTLIALVISAAATAGLYAAVHTVQLGQKVAVPHISDQDLASRQAKLAAWRHSLAAALAKRPPALPKKPQFEPVAVAPQASAPTVAAPPSAAVTYVRPPTVVKYEHAPAATTTTTTTTSSDEDEDSGDDDSGDDGSGDGSGEGG